jgi:hypothetical protein
MKDLSRFSKKYLIYLSLPIALVLLAGAGGLTMLLGIQGLFLPLILLAAGLIAGFMLRKDRSDP